MGKEKEVKSFREIVRNKYFKIRFCKDCRWFNLKHTCSDLLIGYCELLKCKTCAFSTACELFNICQVEVKKKKYVKILKAYFKHRK